MTRLVNSVIFSLCLFSIATIATGCNESNTVIEDTRTEAEIEQEEADYEAQLEATAESDVTE